MRNLIALILFLPSIALATSFTEPVLIGGSGPPSANTQLEVKSTSKGVLLAPMTATQRDAITGTISDGTLVYDLTNHLFSYFNSATSEWSPIGGGDASSLAGVAVATASPSSNQVLTYNSSTSEWEPQDTQATGNITGPDSSTDGAIAVWNGTDGAALKDSSVTVSGSDITGGGFTGTSFVGNGDTSSLTLNSTTDATASGSLKLSHNSNSLLLSTTESSTNNGYHVGISTANIAGSNSNFTGSIDLTTGDKTAGTGSSGNITFTTGTSAGGSRGRIRMADGSETNSPGAVWTISGNTGAGHWVNPSGSRNYIANPDAGIQSSDTTPAGWAVYADTAGVLPVDCTGGSPSTALTRNTSSPIGQGTDFRWTKSADNRQAEGFSYDFTIDKTDQAKVMQIGFDYQVASGTFVAGSSGVDSDLEVEVYDITNSQIIQPTTFKLFSSTTSPPAAFLGNFQTASNSTSYRLCVHTATTSASAYTLAFRNFEVKRSQYTYGTPITDWQSFTPTGSWSANTTYAGQWRRVGSNAEYDVYITLAGAPTSASLTVNLPSGQVIDTAKLASGTSARYLSGSAEVHAAAAGYQGFVYYNSTNSVGVLTAPGASSTNVLAAVTQAVPGTFANGDWVKFRISVPILGWSSSVQMSDSAPQSDVALIANQSSAQTGINPNNSAVSVNYTTVVKDTVGGWNGTDTYTVKYPGFYGVSGAISIQDSHTLASRYLCQVFKNGSEAGRGMQFTPAASTFFALPYSVLVYANAGDTISVKLFGAGNNSSNTLTSDGGTINIFRLGGNPNHRRDGGCFCSL